MGLLDSLAQGLRSAGGILSEDVYKRQGEEEKVAQSLQQQQKNLMAQQVIKGAESGAIPPEVAKQALSRLFPGMEVPVGPDAQTQQRQDEIGRRQKIADGFKALAPEDRSNPLRIAQVFMENGDHERGAKYLDAAETRQARQETLIANLEQRRADLEMRSQDRALDREQRAEMARQANELRATIAQGQQAIARDGLEIRRMMAGQSAEIARGNQELRRLQIEQGGEARRTAAGDRQEKDLGARTQKLQGALEKANLPEANAVLGAVETAVTKAPKLVEYLTGPKSLLPDAVVPAEIRDGRQAFQKLFNITLKNRSGAAVTIPEFERLKAEFGSGVFKTPDQIQNAVRQARDIVSKHAASVAAGFGEDALERYNSDVQQFGGDPVVRSRQAPSGSVRDQADAILRGGR